MSRVNHIEDQIDRVPAPALMFEPVLDSLRSAILSKRLKPGDQLKTGDLAAAMGTSRMPIREALHHLELEGLVERRPHRGLVVASLSVDEVRHAYELVGAIEALATGKAAELITEEGIRTLEAILAEMEEPLGRCDYAAYHAGNRRFHGEICAWYPSQRAKAITLGLWNYIYHLRAVYPPSFERLQQARAEHLRIVDALRQHNAPLAEQIAREHNINSGSELASQLRLAEYTVVASR